MWYIESALEATVLSRGWLKSRCDNARLRFFPYNLRRNLNSNWLVLVSTYTSKPVCAFQSFGPEKRQKSAKFFRITDFIVCKRAIVARNFRDAHACAGGDDPARDNWPRCAGDGANRNRQNAGISDSSY